MKGRQRNIDILDKVVSYCNQIDEVNQHCGNSHEALETDSVYKNAVAMCILQIGELVGLLSDDFRETYDNVPWKDIRGMRNIAAHRYGSFDTGKLWETVTEDIPFLKQYCEEIVSSYLVLEQETVDEPTHEPDMSM